MQAVLYPLWSSVGVKFQPHKAIPKRVPYTEHDNGELLTVRYETEL
jgi:hypothetical protein